ncbi:MAG: SDR family oxidoreductase [Gammaproteobacteria bacterium]
MHNVIVFGATSAIAEATARRYAARGAALFLIARNDPALDAMAADLRLRGAVKVDTHCSDLVNYAEHDALLDAATAFLDRIDVVLIAHGTLPVQRVCEESVADAREAFEVNALSVLSLLTLLAKRMQAQRSGTLAVISSVAGDRGRASNYVYGAAKAAVSTYLEGLRQRVHGDGVHVLTVKPGFVATPMTAHLPQGPLFSTPDAVARGIVRAIDKRRDVVYLPWFWCPIMLVIRLLPGSLLKRFHI